MNYVAISTAHSCASLRNVGCVFNLELRTYVHQQLHAFTKTQYEFYHVIKIAHT
jgi:hypothetical protein